jgi:hypothetical protein
MNNPHPTKRARRLEMRRKYLGADRCFYCPQSSIPSLELDHPVGKKRDKEFKRAVCRNCHREREFERDVAQLTKNGQHKRWQSKNEKFHFYLLLMALDHDSIANALESPHASPTLIARALRSAAASLRRRVKEVPDISVLRTRRDKGRKQRRRPQPK